MKSANGSSEPKNVVAYFTKQDSVVCTGGRVVHGGRQKVFGPRAGLATSGVCLESSTSVDPAWIDGPDRFKVECALRISL